MAEIRMPIMKSTKLSELVNRVMQCQKNCYPGNTTAKDKPDTYEAIINKALLIVDETKTKENPYGFITQSEAFKKLCPLPPKVDGKQLAYKLGPGLGLLKLHKEVGKNWVLTKLGSNRVKDILQIQTYIPLIDQDRKFLLQGCNQSILFISEAPSPDAWTKHVLVDKNNIFLMKSLLTHLKISLEEFEKYFFWAHYSNCFPGCLPNGMPKKPKDSQCYDTHTLNFIKNIQWKGIILMGEYAYKALSRPEPFLEFLKNLKDVPSKLLPYIDTPIMVVPHCSGQNTTARNSLGDKFDLLWDKASKFAVDIIESLTKSDIANIVDQRVRECLLVDQAPEREKDILIFGSSQISQKAIAGIAKRFGISTDRIEFRLSYRKNKRFDIGKLQYSDKYAYLLLGPNAHKIVNLGSYYSLSARLKTDGGFPDYIELKDYTGELKITKETITKAFELLSQKQTHEKQ